MKYRRLGRTELNVSVLGLGCSRLGSVTQVDGDRAALNLIGAALDTGINFFDTADIYGQGASERLLARALKGRRDKVVIATKAGFCLSSLGLIARHVKPLLRRFIRSRPGFAQSVKKVRAAQQKQDFSMTYLQGCIEKSLLRLEIDALDIFLLHSPLTEVLERGEVFEALESFKKQGKLKHYGVSCRKTSDAQLCLKQSGVEVLQLEMNVLTGISGSEFAPAAAASSGMAELLPLIRARDVGVIVRQALAGGLLMRDPAGLRTEDCVGRDQDAGAIKSRMDLLGKLAVETGGALPQIALQFLLEHDAISTVLIGTTKAEHLKNHLAAIDRPPLSAAVRSRLGIPPAA